MIAKSTLNGNDGDDNNCDDSNYDDRDYDANNNDDNDVMYLITYHIVLEEVTSKKQSDSESEIY